MVASEVAPAIRLRNVSKAFRGQGASVVAALDAIDCEIRNQEFVSILGPSGCGKSTLLRILAGLLPYEGDEVSVLGHRVDGPPSGTGIVFQTANLLPWLDVSRNLALGLEIRKQTSDDIEPKRRAMLETLGLSDFEHRYPHELSGGMQQRVAIGQALMSDPQVLLMDEPFGALDALTRDRLNVELLRIWQAQRKTVVLVTHSIPEAVFLSDRVLVLSERPGKLIQDVAIRLPRPRDPATTKRQPEFANYLVQLGETMGVS